MPPQLEDSAPATPRISVIVVSYDRGESLRRTLQALGGSLQIVVVDNGSTDGSAQLGQEFPDVRFSRLPKNFGLTKALNVGLRSAEGEYLLCLHDDARISGEDVTRLADYLAAHPEVGAVAPLLIDAENDLPAPQVRSLPTPSQPDPPFVPAEGEGEIVVECVLGAAIMFRSFFVRAMPQIDERYGNYGSDIEICAQVRRAAKKVVILRDVPAIHEASESPMDAGRLEGDRAAGAAVYLSKYHGLVTSLLYRLRTILLALMTFRFRILLGVLGAEKIDGGS